MSFGCIVAALNTTVEPKVLKFNELSNVDHDPNGSLLSDDLFHITTETFCEAIFVSASRYLRWLTIYVLSRNKKISLKILS